MSLLGPFWAPFLAARRLACKWSFFWLQRVPFWWQAVPFWLQRSLLACKGSLFDRKGSIFGHKKGPLVAVRRLLFFAAKKGAPAPTALAVSFLRFLSLVSFLSFQIWQFPVADSDYEVSGVSKPTELSDLATIFVLFIHNQVTATNGAGAWRGCLLVSLKLTRPPAPPPGRRGRSSFSADSKLINPPICKKKKKRGTCVFF